MSTPGTSANTNEQRLRAAVESSPSGLLMIDARGQIVLVNREIERLFGYPREELLGQPVDLLVPGHLREQHPSFRAGFLGAPSIRAMGGGRELFGQRKDGSEIPVEIGLTPVATEEGLFVISSIVDISARKHAETERQELERQLQHAQKLEAVGRLAGGIAHDFNNILGAITGYAELAHGDASDDKLRQDLQEIMRAAHRGQELVQRIMLFSRSQEIRVQPLDMRRALDEALGLVRATLPAGVQISVEMSEDVARVMADATSISQIVLNLTSNAIHAMPQGGQIAVSLDNFYAHDHFVRTHPRCREGRYVRLNVADSGTGMSEEVQRRAFEPFFTTKEPGSGTGLGLAMVHGLVSTQSGEVLMESRPGAGTLVSCLFPAIDTEAAGEAPATRPTPLGVGERILVVDDEAALLTVASRMLERLGYAVVTHADPRDALQQLTDTPGAFDLVLSDYSMPQMTGLRFAEQAHKLAPELPVVLVSGYVEQALPQDLTAAGIVEVLKKPYTLHELSAVLRAVLAGPSRH